MEELSFMATVSSYATIYFPVVTAVIAAASVIANITPNETDNKIIGGISKVVNWIGLNFNIDTTKKKKTTRKARTRK
jgi:hypothetical protein